MGGPIRVVWEVDSPFFDLIQGLTARASRRWRGEPTEALSDVWKAMKERFHVGDEIDPEDGRLWKIVRRKVSNFFRRNGLLLAKSNHRSFEDAGVIGFYQYQHTPDEEAANRELGGALIQAISSLEPRRRAAALAVLESKGTPASKELAKLWGTSHQNVHKQAKKALGKLQGELAVFMNDYRQTAGRSFSSRLRRKPCR
jgi:DNA-directed RNA polymerase specialized sigma24 family protein